MDTQELIHIGQHLFGRWWKAPLARTLGVHPLTVTRWAAGQPIPSAASQAIRSLYQQGNQKLSKKRYNAKGEKTIIGDAQLIHGDCLKVLSHFPHKVDVILTDPVWPKALPDLAGSHNPYQLLGNALRNAPTLLNAAGRVIIQLRCDSDPRILFTVPPQFPFLRICWLPYAVPSRQGRILISGDVAYIFGRPPQSRIGNHLLPGQIHNDFCPTAQSRDKVSTHHPCPRHLTHVEWLIDKFTSPGDIVLDPFMGSGTTAVAALNRGRKFIGIEIERKYWLESQERIKKLYTENKSLSDSCIED